MQIILNAFKMISFKTSRTFFMAARLIMINNNKSADKKENRQFFHVIIN